jgi:hypothetical protein
MTPEELDGLLATARKYGVKGATITSANPITTAGPQRQWSVEFVFDAPPVPPKEKPDPEAEPVGVMPTRAEIEAQRERIAKGGLK